jgi:hypothetical protein
MASATVALFLVVWFLLPFWLRHRPPPKRS